MPGGEYLSLEHFNNPIALGQVGDPNMMVAGPSKYDSGFVIPDYDPSDPNYQYEVLNKLKAENQGFGMELATAGANLIPNIALSFAETTGYLFDLEDWSNMIQNNKANYGNALTEWASRNKNQFGEVYQKTPGENDISDSAWWVSNGAGLVESLVAFGITGYGVGSLFSKGASALTKALGAYGSTAKAAQGVAQLGTSLTLAYSEGAMTGAQVFKDVYADSYNRKYQENLALGMRDNEAKTRAHYDATDIAGEAATKAVRINTGINTFLNIPETGVLFRSMSSSRYMDDALKLQRGELAKDAVERLKTFNVDKHLTKQGIKHWGKQTGSEMLEEMVNVYAEQEGKNVGREATGQDVKTLGDMLADDDIWAAGFWGAIGGSMNGFVMGQMPKWVVQEDGTKKRTTVGAYTKDQLKNKYEEQLTDLKDRLIGFVDARDALEAASKSGDERAYKEAADKVFSYNSFNSIVKGTEEQLLNDYQNILSLTPEEATQQGFASDYKKRAAEKIQSVKENTAEWNKLQDRYSSQDLDQAGFPETIFQQHINVQNNRKIIEENTIELAKLEAEIAQVNNLKGTDLTKTSFNNVISSIKATEHAFEMATIDLENILNLDKFNSRTQKKIVAELSNMYGNITNARTQIEEHLNELREKREDLINDLEIQKANFYSFIDPANTMSDDEKEARYANTIAQNSADIDSLTEGKKVLEENRKILASQIEELKVLKSDKGLERFKELKKEKMAEREALDAQAAAKAKAEAEAKAKAAKVEEIKVKKKTAPEAVTPQEEEIIQANTPVESFEEGVYSGEGSSKDELDEQYKEITKIADNSDEEGVVKDSSGQTISVGDKLITGSNKLAYASTVEYIVEDNKIKHVSLKLNPETNPDLLTDKYVPGTKLKIKKLTAEEFKSHEFLAPDDIKFIDEVGREILVANKGQKVTFEMLSHPYMQPIGIYNEAGEYQAMLHAVTYINDNRVVSENVETDLQTLVKIRAAVTNQFQDIKLSSKSNGKLNQLTQFYRLSELIDQPVEFAIATSSIQLNTSKTTPVENLANAKGYKVGQIYALTVMPDGKKLAIPVKTTKVRENPQVLTELMSALDIFLKGGNREDLQAIFGKYLHSVFSKDKLTADGNSFQASPNNVDRFYIDFTSTNVKGIIFGKAGFSKNFISGDTPEAALEGLKNELSSIIQESYININFESLKNPDFVKTYVTSNVRFYPLPNGKVTVFDNPVLGFDTSTLISATAPSAKVTPAPVITPIADVFSETTIEERKLEVERIKKLPFQQRLSELKKLGVITEVYRYGNRPVVVVNIAGVNIPFYRSSMGTSGKTKAKWFPFFGFGKTKATDTDLNWLIKADTKSNENNFNSEAIAEYSNIINSTLDWDHSLDLSLQNPFFNPEITFTGDEEAFNEKVFNEKDRGVVNDGGDSILKAYAIIDEINTKYKAEQEILYNPTIITQELKDSVDAELAATDIVTDVGGTTIYYGDYTIYKGEDGTYDVQHNEGDGIIGEYLSTIEEAKAAADSHKKQLENKPTVELKSASGVKFNLKLPNEDADLSITTTEELGVEQVAQEVLPALEDRLREFLSSINVDTLVVDNLQERLKEKGLNTDAVAISDILHKAIFLDSGRYNTMDYAEEVATFAIEFMGASKHAEASPLIRKALDNISSWEKYQQYYDLYKNNPIYKNNERKLKVEILSKLLAEKIIENKDKTKKTKQDKKLTTLETIINDILALFDKIWKSDYYRAVDRFLKQKGIQTKGVNKINIRPFDAVINEIVDDILFNNTSKIINNANRARKGETAVSLKEVLENNPTINDIYNKLNSLGFMFTGSPALSNEGTIYRESNDTLHDLDWQVPKELEDNWLDIIKETFPEITYKINEKTNQAQIFSKGEKTTHTLMIKGMPVDFFISVNPPSNKNTFGDMRWQDTFEAKMDIGRDKDIRDLIDFKTLFNDYFSNPGYLYYSLGQVKPGVEELFNSNPELANEVYEALGFNNVITPDDKIIWGHPAIGKTTAKEQKGFLDFDTDFKPLVAQKLGLPKSQQNSLGLNEWRKATGNEEAFNSAMREVWTLAKEQSKAQNKILMVSDMIFLRENQSDFNKIINVPSTTFIDRAAQRGDNKENLQTWKNKIDQALKNVDSKKIITTDKYLSDLFITTQQKQEALQLYSQYLDSVFPDSQVKDIVYHGTLDKIESFDKSKIGKNTIKDRPKGFYFTRKNVAENIYGSYPTVDASTGEQILQKGNLINAVINTKGQYQSIQEKDDVSGYGDFVEYESYVVFEPEQIHILGSKQDIDGFKEFAKSGKQIEKYVSLQDKVNTLIQEGKATKFCK